MTNSVEIKNLDLNFGTVKVLKQLNLNIVEGEFLVLLGSSGCGKSTLLNCVAGDHFWKFQLKTNSELSALRKIPS